MSCNRAVFNHYISAYYFMCYVCVSYLYVYVQNIQEQIELLVEFLGLPCDENFVKQVVKKCKFHNLKDNKVDTTGAFYPEVKSTLFRKGIVIVSYLLQ